MCTLKNNLLIQIPVKGLIVSPLHAQWLLVMQEWVLHQVVQLCIQDCHTPNREILSVYDRKVLRYLMSKLNPVSSFVFMVLMNIRMAIVMMISWLGWSFMISALTIPLMIAHY